MEEKASIKIWREFFVTTGVKFDVVTPKANKISHLNTDCGSSCFYCFSRRKKKTKEAERVDFKRILFIKGDAVLVSCF